VKAEKVLTEVIHKIVPKTNADAHAGSQVKSSNLIPIITTTEQVLKARAAAIAAAQNITNQIMHQTSGQPHSSKFEDSKKRELSSQSAKSVEATIRDQMAINAEKEAEQRRLEEEMRKRREKIEKWRNEKKAMELAVLSAQEQQQQLQLQQNKKEKQQLEHQQHLDQLQTAQNNKARILILKVEAFLSLKT
jgi:hypothetical protein